MILNTPTAAVIYFLVGLFLAGFYIAFDDNSFCMFGLVLFFWPIVLGAIAIIVAMAIPVVVGRWIGDRIKGWLLGG